MSKNPTITPCTGFTLIELLVVISIVALLLSLLLPALKNSREMVYRVECSSRLRTLGIGVYQYAEDSDDALPMGRASGPFPPHLFTPTWEEMLIRYVNPDAALANQNDYADYMFCTRAPLTGPARPDWITNMIVRGYMTSYVFNNDIFLNGTPYHLRDIRQPSRNMLLACGGGPLVTHSIGFLFGRSELDKRIGYENHVNAANLLFADAHVSAQTAENVFDAVAVGVRPSGAAIMRN